ncbi:hypothetical protein HRJ34_00015 [Rhizorhabdus wittichii]|uniref:Uncharacterized protein n=1 Tax=Rhizorhabdus wittichii TaxID=160791 RepID=A0A975D345_9SPHN|nr:hypothetical protein [Rhizorhabdus wittichii]QTH21963.1 hypothetical protein HRJ34_00015 [Rhizorhabdus wittichii]
MRKPPHFAHASPAVQASSAGLTTDLNALLSDEQSAIMRAEAAGETKDRDQHRDNARSARALIDQTKFPRRDPHDFDATTPAQQRLIDNEAQLALHASRIAQMSSALGAGFSEGLIGPRVYQHHARVIRQARSAWNMLMRSSGSEHPAAPEDDGR